jgi:hypothetical protein
MLAGANIEFKFYYKFRTEDSMVPKHVNSSLLLINKISYISSNTHCRNSFTVLHAATKIRNVLLYS